MSDLTSVSLMSKSPPFDSLRQAEDIGKSAGARLAGEVRRVIELTSSEREQMYALLARYFDQTSRDQFERDLSEKEWAILLREAATGQIQGFSTLMRFTLLPDGVTEHQPVVAFFSGDTIIRREFWGELALPRLWGQHVFRLADQLQNTRVYWFLICSGYKTYRYLPLFFRAFYPQYQHPLPPQSKRLLDHLGRLKFGDEYDAERGIIQFKAGAPLQPGVAEITAQRLKDPHVAFFAQANPGHLRGDELACLAELSRDNLTAAGARFVGPRAWLSGQSL